MPTAWAAIPIDAESLALLAKAIGGRDAHVGQEDLDGARRVDAELDLVARAVEARRGRVDEEGRDALELLLGAGHREEQADVRRLAARDEDLLARDPIGVALPDGAGLLVPGVGAGIRLGQGEAAELLPLGERHEEPLLLVGVAVPLDRVADERVVDREDHAEVGADP
jgi:hypothetical protein